MIATSESVSGGRTSLNAERESLFQARPAQQTDLYDFAGRSAFRLRIGHCCSGNHLEASSREAVTMVGHRLSALRLEQKPVRFGGGAGLALQVVTGVHVIERLVGPLASTKCNSVREKAELQVPVLVTPTPV